MIRPTPEQYDVAFRACRAAIDASGYGGWVSDDAARSLSAPIAEAVVAAAVRPEHE